MKIVKGVKIARIFCCSPRIAARWQSDFFSAFIVSNDDSTVIYKNPDHSLKGAKIVSLEFHVLTGKVLAQFSRQFALDPQQLRIG